MTLPASGQISMSQVNTELGRSSTAQISLGESAVRTLAGVASGQISMDNLHGKSNVTTITVGISGSNYGWSGVDTTYGSISPNPAYVPPLGGAQLLQCNFGVTIYISFLQVTVAGNYAANAFTSIIIGGTSFATSGATRTYDAGTNRTYWTWYTATNPFGTTAGVQKIVSFT